MLVLDDKKVSVSPNKQQWMLHNTGGLHFHNIDSAVLKCHYICWHPFFHPKALISKWGAG